MRPHDILGEPIKNHLPSDNNGGAEFLTLMKQSYNILKDHPVNISRKQRGLNPANSIWLWSPGKKPQLPSFKQKWGINAAVISAVDLIKGIGICADMRSINVDGATGNVNTNYRGKAQAAISAFENGCDLVYVHVEAPDECGHRAEIDNKIKAIELIDGQLLTPVYEYLRSSGDDFKIMVLPDHPTPICKRTHTMDPVPFFIYASKYNQNGCPTFDEYTASQTGYYIPQGFTLMNLLIEK